MTIITKQNQLINTYHIEKIKTITDPELLKGIIAGSSNRYRLLFDRYYEDLVRKSYSITLDLNASKDVVQEVFLKIWQNRSTLYSDLVISSYLTKSTINRSLNFIKSRKLHGGKSDLIDHDLRKTHKDPEKILETKELKSRIEKAIDSLPQRCRLVFVLCKIQGFSHKETAEELSISTKTVENQITKALKLLRLELGNLKREMVAFMIVFIFLL